MEKDKKNKENLKKYENTPIKLELINRLSPKDYNKISEWAKDALEGNVKKGYIKGDNFDSLLSTLN